MTWAAVGVAGVGLVGSLAGGALSSGGGGAKLPGSQTKMQTRAQVQGEVAAGRGALENDLFKEQLASSEKARTDILGSLGAPGTYEDDYESFVQGGGVKAPTGMFNLVERTQESQFPVGAMPGHGKGVYTKEELAQADQYKKTGGLLGKPLDPSRTDSKAEAWILDPEATVKAVQQTRQFRMVSRMTAEADQLQRQEGPMWEKLKQSVQNPILQGAAAMNEEVTANLAREAARGGSARNRAVQTANKIQAQNNIMRDRVNQMWTTNLALKQWTQDNAVRQLAFNQSWVSNLGGVRDMYTQFTQSAQQFYGSQILPAVTQQSGQAQNTASNNMKTMAALQEMQDKRNAEMGKLISGATTTIAGGLITASAQPSSPTFTPSSQVSAESGSANNVASGFDF